MIDDVNILMLLMMISTLLLMMMMSMLLMIMIYDDVNFVVVEDDEEVLPFMRVLHSSCSYFTFIYCHFHFLLSFTLHI